MAVSIFPDFMKMELCDELINRINKIVDIYKNDTKDAVIYSMIEKKTIKSDRRVSHKKAFHSDELKNLINRYINPLIDSMLKKDNPDAYFDIMVGSQAFDYIRYDNGGYFDKHKDFVRVNNPMHRQYTMIIGLTKNDTYFTYGGNTILWFPIDSTNNSDYEKITDVNISLSGEIKEIIKKYNLPSTIDDIKSLLKTNNELPIRYMPHRVNCFGYGKSLLFRSDIIHSGEEYHSAYSTKNLLMLTINITGIDNNTTQKNEDLLTFIPSTYIDKIQNWLNDSNKIIVFDEFEYFMCRFAEDNKLIPFQIIISTGEYNNKTFSDTYVKYLNLQNKMEKDNGSLLERINLTLVEIYEKTKKKLNTRGREYHIGSEILEESSNLANIEKLNGIQFNTSYINFDEIDTIIIDNYVKCIDVSNNNKILTITHTEKINNTWEESSCNDDGDEYEETTYLHCNIDIKFCFLKY